MNVVLKSSVNHDGVDYQAGDKLLEMPEAEAKALIDAGVAEDADASEAQENRAPKSVDVSKKDSPDESADPQEDEVPTVAQLVKKNRGQLDALAEERGVEGEFETKKDLAEAIVASFDESEEDPQEDEDSEQ